MNLTVQTRGRTLIVYISGELDLVTAEQFRSEVDKLLDERPLVNLIVNLKGISFIDSSGLGVLLGRYKRITKGGGKMAIVQPQTQVQRILEFAGIPKLIKIYQQEAEALAQLAS